MKRNMVMSTVAVPTGFLTIAVLGFLTDSALQWAGILPVPSEVRFESEHALLALAHHLAYGLLGSYLAARLAPCRPMAHALALGALGVFVSTLGLIALVTRDLAPAWYGWALIVLSLPVTWLGGKLFILQRCRTGAEPSAAADPARDVGSCGP
jgi:hypothetical protein